MPSILGMLCSELAMIVSGSGTTMGCVMVTQALVAAERIEFGHKGEELVCSADEMKRHTR